MPGYPRRPAPDALEAYRLPNISQSHVYAPTLSPLRMQGFSNPHAFDPDRFSPERREDEKHRRNWLMFGAGPHQVWRVPPFREIVET